MTGSTKIILDCDPGMDDSMAIVLAQKAKNVDLLGIVSSHGNYPIDVTTDNALKTLHMLGANDVPVVRGARGTKRFERLERALAENKQTVIPIDLSQVAGGATGPRSDLVRELVGAVVVTFLAIEAAKKWDRPPFRSGAMNMDASDIKIEI